MTHKDRLARFGVAWLEQLLNAHGVALEVLDDARTKSPHEELLADFMSLVASFSGRLYRLRGHADQRKLLTQAREVIDELLSNVHLRALSSADARTGEALSDGELSRRVGLLIEQVHALSTAVVARYWRRRRCCSSLLGWTGRVVLACAGERESPTAGVVGR